MITLKHGFASFLIFGFILSASTSTAAEMSYDSGYEPTPPVPLPAAYKDYQILPNSVSYNQHFALIYPKRSVVNDVDHPQLFVAKLQPFYKLVDVPLGDRRLTGGHNYYVVNWAKDSSAALIIQGIKWGPDKVLLAPIHRGHPSKAVDLTAEVRKWVEPDFKKAKAPRYNDYFDFIFDSEERATANDSGEILVERGWDLDNHGRVVIDCTCTTDPKPPPKHDSWTVAFRGIWDIKKGRFVKASYVRRQPKLDAASHN